MTPLRTHHVVCLEECHMEIPNFHFPYTYKGYPKSTSDEIAERIKDATIVLTGILVITPAMMKQAPHLKLIAVIATGMDWVDKKYCAENGISVVNCPQSNIPAVSEHAIALFFASRRKIAELHTRTTTTDEWATVGTLSKRFTSVPLSCSQETLGIIGYGALGKQIDKLAKRIGFSEVIISDRKGAAKPRDGRVAFEELLRRASTVILCCPRDPSTVNLIGEAELKNMRQDAVLINVARGGIVNETALVQALREGWINSAATDVLEVEPGIRGSPLLPKDGEPVPNLTITPHLAWYAQESIKTLQRLLVEGVDGWVAGKPVNVAVHDGKIYK